MSDEEALDIYFNELIINTSSPDKMPSLEKKCKLMFPERNKLLENKILAAGLVKVTKEEFGMNSS